MKTSYASVVEFTGAEITAGLANNLPVSVWVLNTTTNALSKGNPSGAPVSMATSADVAVAAAAIAVKSWAASTVVVLDELRRAPNAAGTIEAGDLMTSNSARTTGLTFDATEAGNWTEANPDLVTSVAGNTGAITTAQLQTAVVAASGTPAALGVSAALGTAATAARADHVHIRPTAAEVGAAATSHTHAADATKQDVLVSGTNIKTVDGQALPGSGNIAPTILLVTAPIAIRITGAAGAGTNYPTKLTIGESGGATGANFNLATAAGTFPAAKNATCSFLFWDSIGAIPFWIEKVTGSAPNRVAHVWTLPNIDLSSGTQTIFLTTEATNLVRSDGNSVFTLFDDFDGAAVDTAKWDTAVLSGQTLVSSVLSFGGGNTARRLLTLNTLGDGVEIMSLMRASDTNASTSNFGFVETGATASTFNYRNVWDSASAVMVGTTPNTLTNNINNGAGVLQVMRIGRASGAGRFTSENPVNTFTAASGVPATATKSTIYNTYDNSTEIDWVAVKDFMAVEPAFASAVM